MESDILVEGFRQAEQTHGVCYMHLAGDGDSSVLNFEFHTLTGDLCGKFVAVSSSIFAGHLDNGTEVYTTRTFYQKCLTQEKNIPALVYISILPVRQFKFLSKINTQIQFFVW